MAKMAEFFKHSIILFFLMEILFYPVFSHAASFETRKTEVPYLELFNEIFEIVRNDIYSPLRVKEKLEPFLPRCREIITRVNSMDEFSRVINDCSGRLETSHTMFHPENSQEYFQ